MARALIIALLLAGCASKTDGRSLICIGFCSEQSLKTETTPPEKESNNGPK
jgi:hypothetical protein